jgi:hypothetical protein
MLFGSVSTGLVCKQWHTEEIMRQHAACSMQAAAHIQVRLAANNSRALRAFDGMERAFSSMQGCRFETAHRVFRRGKV